MPKGLFITIEGTDGSGKGTQTTKLVERLKTDGHTVHEISFPQYGKPSAAPVEEYLNGLYGTSEEVGPYRGSILFAVDRYAASKQIRAWLDAGDIVIANRYVNSNMGHQGGKMSDPEERKRYFAWNYTLEYETFGIPKPDINIILHVPAEVAQQLVDKKAAREYLKGKKRDIHEDDLDHLRQAEEAYLDLASQFPDFELIRCAPDGELMSIDQVHALLWGRVQHHLNALRQS